MPEEPKATGALREEVDATIAETERQLAELADCMSRLRQNLAELRRIRQAIAASPPSGGGPESSS